MPRDLRIVVVGAGFGGIGAAIELRRHGFRDVTILGHAYGIGGTWLQNTYPGAACDVPSHLYSYSFALRRDWPRLCSPQEEILSYLREVAREHDVERCVVPNAEVTSCTWDEIACRWSLAAADGRTWNADAVVIATGQLHRPSVPRIAGGETFAGHSFHSAEWDHGYDLRGKRVGVVGTGASSVQFVPEIAEQVEHLAVFQRTGNWFMPRNIVYATGFRTNDFMFPLEITGVGGRTLRETWAEGAHAYLGMTIPGFPSLFVMYGPNTNTSGGSIVVYHEAQASYLRQLLTLVRDRGAAAIDVRPDVEALADRAVQERFANTAWLRCDSWYRNPTGRIVANWPGYMREYVRRTRTLDPSEYTLVPLPEREQARV